MKQENKSTRDYICGKIVLKAGETLEVKDEKFAKILLKQDGVFEAIDVEEVEKLKAELAEIKKTKKVTKKK